MALRRRYLMTLGGAAGVLAIAVAVLGGAATTGRAATTQQVTASITCQPPTVQPGDTVGCTLTVTNIGGNNVNSVTVTDTAPGGTFLSTSSSLCTFSGSTLSCTIGKLTGAGTPGSTFSETHELQTPSSGTTLTQTIDGRYSPNANNRGSDTLTTVIQSTALDSSDDFDGTFADDNGDSVHTGMSISGSNPYTTAATVLGTTPFATGLSVREEAQGASTLCPTGCYGGQIIQFHITPLSSTSYPASFTMTITIAGEAIGPGTKREDLDIYHVSTSGTYLVPMCAAGADPTGDCVVSKDIDPSTKIATIVIQGPGTGNGPWGVG